MQPSQFDFAHSQYTLQETENDVLFHETPITENTKAALEQKVHSEAVKILDLARSLFSTVRTKIRHAERAHTLPNLAELPAVAKLQKLKSMAEAYVAYIDAHSTPELEETKEALLRAEGFLQVSIDQIEKKAQEIRREAQAVAAPASTYSLSGLFQITKSAISSIFSSVTPESHMRKKRAELSDVPEQNETQAPPSSPAALPQATLLRPSPAIQRETPPIEEPTPSVIPLPLESLEPKEETHPPHIVLPPQTVIPPSSAQERVVPASPRNPLSQDFQNLVNLHKADPNVKPLLEYMGQIPEIETSEQLQKFCSSLIEHVADNGLTATAAKTHLARFLFLLDKQKDVLTQKFPASFTKQTAFLEKQVARFLDQICKSSHPHKAELPDIFAEEVVKGKASKHGLMFENQYALTIAEILLRPDGSLYPGLLDDAKKQLVASKKGVTAIDRHILEVFDALKKPEIERALLKIGATCPVGKQIVKATLGLNADELVTAPQARICALAALLGRWRQIGYGTCHVYSASAAQTKISPETVLNEYNAVLAKGSLSRHIEGREVTFAAIPKMTLYALARNLDSNITAEKLGTVAPLRRAFEILGASHESVNAAITAIRQTAKPLTVLAIFNHLKPQLTDLTEDAWQMAHFTGAGIGEMPLPRVWNNAIGSMFFPPLTSKHETFENHTMFKNSILKTFTKFIDLAKVRKTTALKNKLDLTQPHFAALEKLRIFVAPPDVLARRYGECSLYIQEGDTLRKIETEEQCGAAIKEIFLEIATQMKLPALIKKLNSYTDAQVAQRFLTEFSTLHSVSESFDPLYVNKPWSFKLVPTYFDSFWSTYLKTETTTAPSKKIQFSDTHNAAKNLLEWAATLRTQAGTSPQFVVPAKFPPGIPHDVYGGHAIVLTPNHPTMIPREGQTVDAMLQEKMEKVASLTTATARKTIEEATDWAEKYIKKHYKSQSGAPGAEEIIARFKDAMTPLESSKPPLQLQVYLTELTKKVTEACTQAQEAPHKIDPVSLDELSNFCLHGLLSDIKGAEKNVVLHFGDSLWEYEPKGGNVSVPLDLCFFPNPLTGKWHTAYLGTTARHAYEKPCQIPLLTIYGEPQSLRKESTEQEILVTSPDVRQKIRALTESFITTWNRCLSLKDTFSAAEKEALISCRSFDDLDEALNKIQPSEQIQALRELIDLKKTQQRDFRQFCRTQSPSVEPTRDAVYITRLLSDARLKALDSTADDFLTLLKEQLSL